MYICNISNALLFKNTPYLTAHYSNWVHWQSKLSTHCGAPEECSPLSKTGQTEDKVNLNSSHSPYISALCLPSDLDRTLASVQLHIALWMTPIYCLSSLYPQFIFRYLEFSFTLTSQFSYFMLTGGEHCWSWYWFPFMTFGAIHIRQAQKFELFFWSY